MSGTRLALVCGLAAEAKIVQAAPVDPGIAVVTGGGDGTRIRAALDRLQPAFVLSFGIAGGLAPDLAVGCACVAKAVLAPDGRLFASDGTWSRALAAALEQLRLLPTCPASSASETLGAPLVLFAGVDAPLADAGAKAGLHRASGAAIVDMESHHAGAWAHDHGALFAALRVVTDGADRSLPHAATVGMRADGSIDMAAIVRSLLRDPRQVPALIRTGREARTAFAALLRCRQRLGTAFARVDL